MTLRYTFARLFYDGRIQKERLYKVLQDLDSASGGDAADIDALEESVGALETTVGSTSSGLVKKTNDLETAIGDEETEGTILARIKALEDAQ